MSGRDQDGSIVVFGHRVDVEVVERFILRTEISFVVLLDHCVFDIPVFGATHCGIC